MARSYKKNFCGSNTSCKSEKKFKRNARKRERTAVQKAMHATIDHENMILPTMRELHDVWLMGKDGKRFYTFKNVHTAREFYQLIGK